MKLSIGLRWLVDDVEIDARLIDLMCAIDERGSLKQAIGRVGMSYRHAWERLGRLESMLGARLVELERGRGAHLTGLGKQLVACSRDLDARLKAELLRAARVVNRSYARNAHASSDALLVCASHDFALGRLAELLPRRGGPAVELRIQGSLDALATLARRRCDIAGFHVPALPGRQPLIEPFLPLLRRRPLRLVRFADRRQGLIVASGNPAGIAALADLARLQARFVNRQAGSGTRLFFDALLASHRIRPAQINGYRHEEFTHAAVAAMIASGAADAGFGIEAAAAQHGLSFVPLASERYFLVMRENVAARPAAQMLLAALSSRWFRRIVRALPGYTEPASVELLSVQEAFVQPQP
ncbi:MAG: helix-turn-helix transcriptional regulator [Burkholderiales bacterium]|nr:helix-turn-helix transcriptional regulator [Burkholderiales bacterium]